MELSLLANIILAPLCTCLIGILVSQARQLHNSDKAMRDGMRTLLRQQLVNLHREYVLSGCAHCPLEIKEQATRIYEAYHALDGNGTGTKLYAEIMAVPTG